MNPLPYSDFDSTQPTGKAHTYFQPLPFLFFIIDVFHIILYPVTPLPLTSLPFALKPLTCLLLWLPPPLVRSHTCIGPYFVSNRPLFPSSRLLRLSHSHRQPSVCTTKNHSVITACFISSPASLRLVCFLVFFYHQTM